MTHFAPRTTPFPTAANRRPEVSPGNKLPGLLFHCRYCLHFGAYRPDAARLLRGNLPANKNTFFFCPVSASTWFDALHFTTPPGLHFVGTDHSISAFVSRTSALDAPWVISAAGITGIASPPVFARLRTSPFIDPSAPLYRHLSVHFRPHFSKQYRCASDHYFVIPEVERPPLRGVHFTHAHIVWSPSPRFLHDS